MDALAAVRVLGGVAEARALSNAKVSRRSIEAALIAGSLVKVRRGCVAVPEADPTRVAEVAWRAERTCLTLARQLELPVMSGNDQVHVAVSAHRSFAGRHARPARDVVFHYAEPTQAVGPLARAIDTASLCVGRLDQLIMLDAALNRRSLELKALDAFTVTSARTVAWLRARADSSAESPIETLARLSLATLGVRVLSQVTIPGVGRVDFLVEDSVIVEMDGRAHHSDAAAFSRDRARDRAAAALGLVVLRFTFADATTCPGLIAGDVLAALRARRPRAVPA